LKDIFLKLPVVPKQKLKVLMDHFVTELRKQKLSNVVTLSTKFADISIESDK